MIKCVAIDDEPIALQILEEYCRQYGHLEIRTFSSPVDGMNFVRLTCPEIVFLDIEMNSHNGLDLAAELPSGTCLIFTTAYAQYAIDGFNADAIDFLNKPIFYNRFERAIHKAEKWIQAYRNSNDTHKSHFTECRGFTVKSAHKNILIHFAEILYVEAMDNYVKIHRLDTPTVITQTTMKEMENILPDSEFVRVHRSFIVATRNVAEYSSRRLTLAPKLIQIPIGRKYLTFFIKIMKSQTCSDCDK